MRVQCSLQDAYLTLRHQWMREALLVWIRRSGWEHLLCLPPLQQPQQQQQLLVAEPAQLPTPERVAVQS